MVARESKLPYLPDDIIKEILLRSPVKSVGRFRCLSKMFCSMLSDPKFAKNQLELTRRRSKNVALIMSSLKKLFLVDLDSIVVECEYSVKVDLIILFYRRTLMMGSLNGLVCLRCVNIFGDRDEDVLLYNPITRDSKRIPELPDKSVYHQWSCSYGFGFGFDSLTNDYKVVKLISIQENEHTVCYVYSLKTDSWRRLNNLLPYYIYVDVCSANLKGAIHWIALTEEGEEQKVLMAFDLEKDELREMTLPNWPEEFDLDLHYVAVDILKGCLCVVPSLFKMHNTIWVMKEYGIESSWSKIKISVPEYSIKPTLCLSDKEFLLVLEDHFVYKKGKIGDEELYTKMKASSYVESLISPNSYAEQI